ncbi:MAG: hypothetical protein DYG96_14895, partial [Chlorobi bacterium CHB2]|nr:hypothetical protein [Chlorobi bacterium CHB2]
MMKSFLATALAAAAIVGVAGCGSGDDPASPTTPTDTISKVPPVASFTLLQTELFAKSCAISGCHAGTTPTGGLSLNPAVAWKNLVGIVPANEAAAAEGMQRVMPGQPERSFLLKKLSGELGPN